MVCFSSSPSFGCAPDSQFCTVVVTGQYSQPTTCPSVTETLDSVAESKASCELVLVADHGAVIRCASNTWLNPQPVLEVKQNPSSYSPSWALVTAAPAGTELRSNCSAARHA